MTSAENDMPPGMAGSAPRAGAWPGDIQGIQSVELGLDLFRLLAGAGAPCGLSDLARQAGMHRAKAYRYLVSLARAGWVSQDARTGRYDVGPAVRDLALSWLARQDPLRLAGEEARALAQTLGETCFVAVNGQGGVTAVRVCLPGQGVSVGVSEGALFDLESSATGRIFAAWQDPPSRRLAPAVRRDIRSSGLAMVEGEHVPGINALSVPVLDAQGRLLLALTLVGHAGSLRADPDSPAARALRAAGRRVSAAVGG
ncbi:IclR family transcriptional regulator [uncultured Castellaniella sp.]|uniref:IclR family transcriptional regulator n=1 Tax=uncultured Castellaniella sp. TaxID=647907 RepID=UPI00261D125F|nr:IclR family transcriptional regulator [uncultured Castellaniella sp.]